MYLSTQELLGGEPETLHQPLETTWPAVREGLHKVLAGYAVLLGACILVALAVVWVTVEAVQGQFVDAIIDTAMLMYFGAGLVFLMSLLSLLLVVTGKLRCLINVPERCGAKWMMFVSILFFVACPTLDFLSRMIPSKVKPEQVMAILEKSPLFRGQLPQAGRHKGEVAIAVFNEVRDVSVSLAMLDHKAWLAIAGTLSGLLSTAFFVLFMRAVAKCFYDRARQIFAELYLFYDTILLGTSVYLFFNPPNRAEQLPLMLLILAAGYLLSLVWYVALIVSTSWGIACGVAWRDAAMQLVREA
jgi:hypothetical protein